MDKKAKMKIAIIVLIVASLIITALIASSTEPTKQEVITNNTPVSTSTDVIVQIKGEVKKPGLYSIQSDARVYDVILIAGGFTSSANADELNLAMKVADEMVIVVPSKEAKSTVENQKTSINKASISELMRLEGIGATKAQNIIDYRSNNGSFKTLEELMNVTGISSTIYNKIKEYICL